MDERDQQRKIRHRVAVLRHAAEVAGNVSATCRCLRHQPPGSFEFASPDMAPIFDSFNQWAFANRSDVIEGPCAGVDGTSDPAECATAVLEAANEYVADPNT
jgi:hypothetical protein